MAHPPALLALALLALALALPVTHAAASKPGQVHLGLGSTASERTVSFVTLQHIERSAVRFYPASSPTSVTVTNCTQRDFHDGGATKRRIVLHECVMAPLRDATVYMYQVGDALGGGASEGWSQLFNFTTWHEPHPDLTLAVYGDMGVKNARTLPWLRRDLERSGFDAVLHVGDFAYNLDSEEGALGDRFMEAIEPLAAHVPYIVCLGNHESAYNFSHYTERFAAYAQQGNSGNNWWYSFDLSYVHFVALSSELYYNADIYDEIQKQNQWLERDLAAVDRAKTPFVVVFLHRPLYCSNTDDLPDCTTDAQRLRDGFTAPDGTFYSGLEKTFLKYSVNLVMAAHEHSYERTWPVRNSTAVTEHQEPNRYENAQAPTYIVTGAAGCPEDLDYYDELHHGPWSLVRSASYGYAHFRIVNSTHLHFEQFISDGLNGTDAFWYVQTAAPQAPRPDIATNVPLHQCSAYCAAVCLYSGKQAEQDCATQCRCEREHAAGRLAQVAAEAGVTVKRGLVHKH